MNLSPEDLRELVARATPLPERPGVVAPTESPDDVDLVEKRLLRWREAVGAEGDDDLFIRHLSLAGLDEDSCRSFLGGVHLSADQPLPAWINPVIATLHGSHHSDGTSRIGYDILNPEQPLPFEEIWLPFVESAYRQLQQRAASVLELVSAQAHTSLCRGLLGSLAALGEMVLSLEFELWKCQEDPLAAILESTGHRNGENSREHYDRFIDRMQSGGLTDVLVKYAVLTRLLGTRLEQWIETTVEFFSRLEQDLPAIERRFRDGQRAGSVTALSLRLSDPHNGGRTVIGLEFSPDPGEKWKLIYKPRGLGAENAFVELLEWLNERDSTLGLKTLEILSRESHGWVEFVEARPCEDAAQVRRYYRRAGMLLCLLRALSATDCHCENLIASGEYPVLVDVETLMHPVVSLSDEWGARGSADRAAVEVMLHSVLRSGLLPAWSDGIGGKSYDASGLGATEDQETGQPYRDWVDVNTDRMGYVERERTLRPRGNAPFLAGEAQPPRRYVRELVDGFDDMYNRLVASREELTSSTGPLAGLRDQFVRFLMRGTQIYGHLLDRLCHPEFLTDGADRSIELEVLTRNRILAHENAVPGLERVHRSEQRAIERLDIPYFRARPDSAALFDERGALVEDFFDGPSYDRTLSLLAQLDEEDREIQVQYISAAVHARHGGTTRDERNAEPDLSEVSPLSREEWIEEAAILAEELRRQAIRGTDGSVTWIGLGFDPVTELERIESLGPGLYDGQCGVALFLAALAQMSGNAEYGDLASRALQSVRQGLAGSTRWRHGRSVELGVGSGLGSLIYSLVRIGLFLDNEELVEDSERAADLVLEESVRGDESLDVIGGSAGAILGLLGLADVREDNRILERAVWCGRNLLARRTTTTSGFRAWQIPKASQPWTGFSHGAAGISYALVRLFGVTGDAKFLDGAREGIAFETSAYSKEHGKWASFRGSGPPTYLTAWCHGAAGIGLARLGGLPFLDTSEIRQDIENALAAVLSDPLRGPDHICCGTLGRLELLITAAQKLDQPELLEEARRRAAWVVGRAREVGGYTLQTSMSTPSLFQGTSGIGYQLLRLADPGRVPSVLLWD